MAVLFPHAVRESVFDDLHGSFNGHAFADRQEQMQMIRHDDKVVQPKLFGRDVRTKHTDHQSGIPRGSRHPQGLKPNSFPQRCGTAQAVP
jgi:hypothetical protein